MNKITNTHIILIAGAMLLSVIILAGGLSLLAFAGAIAYCLYLFQKKQELMHREWKADIALKEREASFCAVPSRHGILSYNSGLVQFWTKSERSAPGERQLSGPDAPETEPGRALTALDIGGKYDRVIMAGSTRSGKSFASKQIAYLKLQQGHTVVVLDPKPIRKADTWPEGVMLFGCNDDYADMQTGIDFIESERERRAADFDNIERYPKLTIFWDEFANCLLDCPDFQPAYLKILTKYAEYRIDLFIITQADDVESCGLPKVGYKRNFRAVLFFQYDEFSEIRQVFFNDRLKMPTTPETALELIPFRPVGFSRINHVNVSNQYPQPGTFTQNNPRTDDFRQSDTVTLTALPEGTREPHFVAEPEPEKRFYESKQERDIVKMFESGCSLNQIGKEIFGYNNGKISAMVKDTLSKHNLL